jgi:intracellular sulfur oxidation DsrE/DsrF family protein
MLRRDVLVTIGATLAAAAPTRATAAQSAGSGVRDKLVMQVSDGDAARWILALSNARNVQSDLGRANVDIEIVVYGPGIDMLKMESVVGPNVAEALAAGVNITACENTMIGQHLSRDDMLPAIGYVKAGVVRLMRRQQEGYAYVRP